MYIRSSDTLPKWKNIYEKFNMKTGGDFKDSSITNIKHRLMLMLILFCGIKSERGSEVKVKGYRYGEKIDSHKRSKRERG